MREMQRHIIATLGSESRIDAASEVQRRIDFLADYARSVSGFRGFVLGISGGQDSSLAGRLCQLAVEQLRAAGVACEFLAMRLPYGTQLDEDDAQCALEFIRPDRRLTVNIKATVDALVAAVSEAVGQMLSDFQRGNVKARARMMAQYAVAGEEQMLVVGTDHAAEAVTGFYTKYGDGGADVMPLAGLTKEQGAQLLKYLGAPDRLWQKVPTADLLDGQPGRSDESELGLSYQDIDRYLSGGQVDVEVAEGIEAKFRGSEHKRRMPATPSDVWWKQEA